MVGHANRKLGKFEILQKLGRGGMADVYLARDGASGERVALKIIEHGDDPDTGDAIEAERRGSALQARLAAIDPRVVRIYETDDTDGYFFVSMEYVEGEDLSDVIRRGAIEPARAAEIGQAICETLGHAHTLQVNIAGKDYQGIVHGDIKPRNIRIEPRGGVRVLDFGIAKALSLSRRLTRNEFGSVPYASPERLDTGDVDVLSDLWSLGVMLYEMAAGVQPYRAESTEKLERHIRSRVLPPPCPGVPEPLARIIARSLAPDPGQRYQSAAEMAIDLAAFRDGGDVTATIDFDDIDATRRTTRRDSADADETRRTTRPAATPTVAAVAKPANLRRRRIRQAIGYLVLGFALYLLYAGASNYLMWNRGQELQRAINAEQVTDLDQIWQRWTELSGTRSSSLLLYGPRHTVKARLLSAADRVIAGYRNEAQAVYEKDWDRARGYLAKALALDPGDDSVRGRLRLCEGHIARINGSTGRRNTGLLNEAVEKFEEAQRLMSRSPDPQLGLARTYVYGLKNIDKAYDALKQAERRGYKLGNREKSQLADGYCERADRLWWDSRNIRGLPQEQDQIQRAADDYHRALDLYQEIMPYGEATAKMVRVQSSLEGVEFRLKELEGSSGA